MNLFVLDRDPQRAARAHCDRHVVKMVLETAQLLSTAHACLGEAEPVGDGGEWTVAGKRIYRPTHQNHPCALWVRESAGNYRWAYALLEHLLDEYQRRYGDKAGKRHQTWDVLPALKKPPRALLKKKAGAQDMTPFAQAMPEQYRKKDAVAAYRAYYRGEKAGMARYHLGGAPQWMRPALDDIAGRTRSG